MASNSAEGSLARETDERLSRASSRVSIASLVSRQSPSGDEQGTLMAAEALGSLKTGGSLSYESRAACESTANGQFIQRVQNIPLVSSAKEMYTKSKQSNIIVRVGGGVIESGVKRVVEPISKRIPAGVDDFACRQLDNLGYTQQEEHATMPINNLRKRTKDQAEEPEETYDNGKTKDKQVAGSNEPDSRRWGVGSLIASAKERAVAYREDSMRRLKYCLEWVTYATALLSQHMQDLRKFLESLQDAARILLGGQAGQEVARVGDPPQATSNVREAAVKLAQRRREIVVTVKRAVGIISQYAGSVLPGEARRQVRGLILSLPGRWMTVDTAVSATSSVGSDESPSVRPMDTSGNIEANARRTLAFATESFYMLDSVRNVFQNLYANAERWVGAPAEQPETVPLVEARERPVPVRRPPKKLPPGLAMTPAEEPSGKRLSTQSLVEIGEQMRRMDMSQSRAGAMDIDDAVPLASPRLSAMRTTYDEAVANKRNRTREPSPTR